MDTEDPELAAEGVVDDLEDMRDGVLGWIGIDGHRSHGGTFAFEEGRRIAFRGIRHEARDHLDELVDAGPGRRRHVTDRDQVRLAQRRLEGIVQLLGLELLALLEIDLHQGLVDLDHLVDDPAVGLRDG